MRLQNKVAIITGAASGMGEAMAYTFAKEGAKIIATDIQEEKLNKIVAEIRQNGGGAIAVVHNVASREDWLDKVIPAALKEFGTIDILINNAGISIPKPFIEQTEETWNKAFAINVNSVMLGIQAVLPTMEKKGGSIVNVSSIAALTGMSGPGVYTASKGGVSALTRAAAVDFGPMKIRVNAINPGYIMTPMSEPHLNKPEVKAYFENIIPLKDFGVAQDIANAALFLASDESKYISGINLPVDGAATVK
jgi:NAD(P)-dependent dehydrogenase (short-subunit alcohol dehydrogenase family)